jgi:hypothetical protein
MNFTEIVTVVVVLSSLAAVLMEILLRDPRAIREIARDTHAFARAPVGNRAAPHRTRQTVYAAGAFATMAGILFFV